MRGYTLRTATMEQRLPGLAARALALRRDPVLLEAYQDYVARVSAPDWAISLELASTLLALCWTTGASRVLDLGSGFSSYVLRRYQAEAPRAVEVWSVDDDPGWLDKTQAFLQDHRLPTVGLMTWEQFQEADAGRFDLVLHDLGTMSTRTLALPRALASARPGGMVVLDDVHMPWYAREVQEVLQDVPHIEISFYSLTLDRYGRYAMLVEMM